MRRVYGILAAVVALSLLACASARGDVVHRLSLSGTTPGTSLTIPITVPAGNDRLLAVAVSTANTGVSGVTYGQQALTQRFAQTSADSAVYIYTLVAPPVGSADLTITGDAASKVVGASLFTGVDQANPVISTQGQTRSDTGMVDSVQLHNTVAGDGIFGAITVGNAVSVGGFTTRAFADSVTPVIRWNLRSGNVLASGATRGGNQGTIPDAYILWQWNANFMNPTSRVTGGIALRRAAPAVLPTVTTGSATGVTRTSATLAGTVSSDGEGELTRRGAVYCASPCTPEVDAPGTSVSFAGLAVGSFTVAASPLAPSTTYTYRTFATNAAGTAYGLTGGFTTLADQAPTASAGGPYFVTEGLPLTLNAGGSSDPEGDTLTYSWDVNGDGTYGDATGVSPTLTWTQLAALGLDGPTTRQVKVRVSDATTTVTSAAATLTVANVAPAATLGNDGPVVEGSDATITFAGASDPSAADTAAGFHYAFDLDDDGTYDVGDGTYAGSPADATSALPTDDDGVFTVRAAIIDRDGGITPYTTTVTVTNAAPTASVTAAAAGSTVTLQPAATDPSSEDIAAGFTYEIDWGDGATQTVTGANATHTYASPGSYTVSVVAIDKDGARSAPRTLAITIAALPAAPRVTPAAEIARVSELSARPRCVSGARDVTLRYRLNVAATVRVSLQRRNGSDWRHCPPAHGVRNPAHKPVTYAPVTSKQVSTGAGSNTLVVASRARGYAVPIALLTKGRRLRPGTYVVTLTTLDANGRALASATVKFWVLRG